jgi:hypothetical protein
MVNAGWYRQEDRQLYAVRCRCGAEHISPMMNPHRAHAPDDPSTAAQRRTERLVWATFVRHAREGTCADCLRAAGRWLREEPGAAQPIAT